MSEEVENEERESLISFVEGSSLLVMMRGDIVIFVNLLVLMLVNVEGRVVLLFVVGMLVLVLVFIFGFGVDDNVESEVYGKIGFG